MSALLLLIPAVLTWMHLLHATRPVPSLPWLSEIADREGRQCFTGVYGSWMSPPERCAYPEDHYGRCEA